MQNLEIFFRRDEISSSYLQCEISPTCSLVASFFMPAPPDTIIFNFFLTHLITN